MLQDLRDSSLGRGLKLGGLLFLSLCPVTKYEDLNLHRFETAMI